MKFLKDRIFCRIFLLLALLFVSVLTLASNIQLVKTDNYSINFGDVVFASIDPAGEVDTYTFSANAGDATFVRMTKTSGSLIPEIRLHPLNETELAMNWTNDIAEINYALPDDGWYEISASDHYGNFTGNYSMFIQRLNEPGNATPVGFGDTIFDSINPIGDADTYTFSANAGNTVFIRVNRTSDTLAPEVRLYAPNGTELARSWNDSIAEISETLVADGNYTILTFDHLGTGMGNYSMFLTGPAEPSAPVASFTYSPLAPYAGEAIIFNASGSYDSDGYIANYTWDFDDGNITTVSHPIINHTYTDVDTYMVSLTVIDNEELTNTISKFISTSNLIWLIGDQIGDVSPDFIDIIKGSILDNGTHLTVIIELDELPHELYFNDPATPDNKLEYEWSLYIDTDGDPSTGSASFNGSEVCISIMHFKPPTSLPTYDTIINGTQQNIWIFNSTTESWHAEADITAIEDFSTHSLIMIAPLQLIPMENPLESTNLIFKTSYIFGEADFAYSQASATKPVADAGSDQTVNEDTIVTFNGSNSFSSIGNISYVWTFSDGTLKNLIGINPTYNFTTPGTYTVTLNVTDATGNWDTDTVVIIVLDVTDPKAEANIDQVVVQDKTVSFDAENSSDNVGIVSYEWDFGDGTNGTGISVNHTYAEPGNYTVTLTVKDAAENEDTYFINVTVLSAETALEPRSVEVVAEVVAIAATVTTTATVIGSGIGQSFNSAVSKLPIPDEIKKFLKFYGEKIFETVDKAKLAALQKASFITKGELAALGISTSLVTIVLSFVEANGLPRFLDPSVLTTVIPSTLVSVCIVKVAGELFEAFCTRGCKVYRRFSLWLYGSIVFLVSGFVLLFPFSSPGIARYQSGKISDKTKVLIVLSKTFVLLTLTIPFAGLYMLGFQIIGDAGLFLTLMNVCFSLVPIKPLVGKVVFDYRKDVSVATLIVTIILFLSCANHFLPHITYLIAGIASIIPAAITLKELRKTHQNQLDS